ncbi:MAG: 7-carboxy-7-deazaguanine synthase QueE [Porticoccaceae bacterium]|nr:7-carboxy-7-deazaguanine synthase QueE [Pseudomonadales bacterium]MCP5173213.1 7-carboxy-7-deazaguanine synthase QueE [Pseudomonadales bacterium]
MSDSALRITEIFHSLQGESSSVGLPTVFIRLTGCPLRCHYCDTEYAFHGGEKRSLDDILNQVQSYNAQYVTVTGGEPLAQPDCLALLSLLCDKGYRVSLETSGAMSVEHVDPRVVKVLDLKTPASGESARNLYHNVDYLQRCDEVKFVICDQQDYLWARMKMDELKLTEKVDNVLFSPSFGQQDARALAEWILKDQLPVRFQMQLHKQLWNEETGR